jgi:integrase/recombinase XerD
MLMILARLGLRAPEVIAIQLDDIDWRAGAILIRGKGKRHDRMPLPEEAGQGHRRLHPEWSSWIVAHLVRLS